MVVKLSTRQPDLESRMKVLKAIASENGISLQIEEESSITTEVGKQHYFKLSSTEAGNCNHGNLILLRQIETNMILDINL